MENPIFNNDAGEYAVQTYLDVPRQVSHPEAAGYAGNNAD